MYQHCPKHGYGQKHVPTAYGPKCLACIHERRTAPRWRVEYPGFLQYVAREFETQERAEQWARQAGVYGRARIFLAPAA